MLTERTDVRLDNNRRALHGAKAQRVRLWCAAIIFIAALKGSLLTEYTAMTTAILGGILALTGGLTVISPRSARVPRLILPLSVALIFSAAIAAAAIDTASISALQFGFMFVILGAILPTLAPTRRDAILALTLACAVGLLSAIFIATRADGFDGLQASFFVLISAALPQLIGGAITDVSREARTLQGELARRATSDEITGVSNRAHINLLAQNEFARARRYGEPYSCLTIEIENYERLQAAHGTAGLTAIVQVFTGYCVVVMRHCDSFGRLTPNRFLALLPETPGVGAHTLASRMCRDLAALEVSFGGEKLHFTVAIGCADMHAVDRWAGDMLRRSDQGLADAFERGGNCAVLAAVPVHQPAEDAHAEGDSQS